MRKVICKCNEGLIGIDKSDRKGKGLDKDESQRTMTCSSDDYHYVKIVA